MARYRKIDPRIWNDAKFRDLSDSAKLVFFMLLTHPSMTSLGAMRASVSGLGEELGWEQEAFREAFQEVINEGMAEHDAKACMVALPNFIKYNPPESPNVVKAWGVAFDLLPECKLKTRVVARSVAYAEGLSKGFGEALPKAFAQPMPYQEQEQEQEQDMKKAKTVAGFSPSSADANGSLLSRTDDCPHQAIIELFHEHVPTARRVRDWTAARGAMLRARWREDPKRQNTEWWVKFFTYVALSPFLTGRITTVGRKPFELGLDWLLKPENFAKVREGAYHDAGLEVAA